MRTAKIGIKNQDYRNYLMIQRDGNLQTIYRKKWDVVGGVILPNETALEAVMRENKEETGGIGIFDIVSLGEITAFDCIKGNMVPTLVHLFLGKTHARIDNIKTEKDQKAGYFSLDGIMKLDTLPNLKELVKKYRRTLERF